MVSCFEVDVVCEAFFPLTCGPVIVLGILFMLVFIFPYSTVVAVGTSPVNMQESSSFYYYFYLVAANLKQISL